MATATSLLDAVDCSSTVPLGGQLTAAYNNPEFQQQATSAGWELESGPLNAGPGTVRVYVAMRDPAGGPTACSVIVTDVPSTSYGCTDL